MALLVTHFKYISLFMSVPNSLSSYSKSVSLFLYKEQNFKIQIVFMTLFHVVSIKKKIIYLRKVKEKIRHISVEEFWMILIFLVLFVCFPSL